MLRRDLTHALLLLLLFRPPQYGKPNLAGNFGYLGELDLHEVCDKHGVDLPIGNQTRNECYYQLMKSSGVTGAGKNVRAPEYVRKAARSAFDYDGPGLMPKNHFDAYMGGINIDVDEIQVAIHLMLAGVDVGEEAIHPDGYRTVQQPRLGPESTTVAYGHPLASFLCKNCPLSVAFACCDDDWSWVTSTVP